MTVDRPARSRTKRRERGSTSGFPSEKQEEPEPKEMVKVERTVRRRVLKVGKNGRRPVSDANEPVKITSKEMEITREVVGGTGGSPAAPAPAPSSQSDQSDGPKAFTCAQCGASIPADVSHCPKCESHYLEDISDEKLRGLESAELDDAEGGTISHLREDHDLPNVSVVCSNCKTEIEFQADRCPICGTMLDKAEGGLVSLFTDMEFDSDESTEMDCPFCGEHVVLVNGTCPSCDEVVRPAGVGSPSERIDPVIRMGNVVFLHLDVSTGEVNFLQKLANKQGFEQVTVRLDGTGQSGFDKDWKDLSGV